MTLEKSLQKTANLINQRMTELLPVATHFADSNLVKAMHYSAIAKGKKIRPFLLLATADLFDAKKISALDTACALEFIHIYSLIHDDLPAMDDDDFRRGEPSCHKKFNEATAILAGDALLTYAFEILSDEKIGVDAVARCQLINQIAKSIGFNGMAGGQMMDLEAENQALSEDQIFKLHSLKTGKMFTSAVLCGAILGNADQKSIDFLDKYSADIGLAFQIKDDILDFEENKITPKSKPDQASIVNLIGLENSLLKLEELKISAIGHLKNFGHKADLLIDLVDFIITRKN